jgi:hypothetical protein
MRKVSIFLAALAFVLISSLCGKIESEHAADAFIWIALGFGGANSLEHRFKNLVPAAKKEVPSA